jgi:hypothetical protein
LECGQLGATLYQKKKNLKQVVDYKAIIGERIRSSIWNVRGAVGRG